STASPYEVRPCGRKVMLFGQNCSISVNADRMKHGSAVRSAALLHEAFACGKHEALALQV
ncbi:MAG: hypothetical protein IJV89_07190, partial [Lentisphaeria bacterium]|nr:hypothetical protein [Lentisphaeria bacterium]